MIEINIDGAHHTTIVLSLLWRDVSGENITGVNLSGVNLRGIIFTADREGKIEELWL